MKVITAKEIGFCFGVKRAIHLTKKALQQKERDVFILGDLIHNRQVIREFENRGLKRVNDIEDREQGTLVVRAHGLPPETIIKAKKQGFDIVDATCPIVKRAQMAARSLEDEGYQIIIVGDKNHAEIKGIVASLKKEAVVISSITELKDIQIGRRVGLIFQTTQSIYLCQEIIGGLLKQAEEIKIINTICSAIKTRQDEAVQIAKDVDLLIVVGDATSANTIKMKMLCEKYNKNTIQIENATELDPKVLLKASKIGIVAGASTPNYLIEEVQRKLLE